MVTATDCAAEPFRKADIFGGGVREDVDLEYYIG
jgi:hypothetical protein